MDNKREVLFSLEIKKLEELLVQSYVESSVYRKNLYSALVDRSLDLSEVRALAEKVMNSCNYSLFIEKEIEKLKKEQ